jgi:cytochrome c-type biogenesis protein CcmF
MLIGKLFLSGAVCALLAALVLFKMKYDRLMRVLFSLSVFFLIASLAVLLLLLLSSYSYAAYVVDNSSPDMPFMYKITALWAGQQGSWLFWTCLLAVCSLPRIYKGRRNASLVLMSLILVFSIMTLLFANPFAAAASPLHSGGYNPVLKNIWMAIHPPLLFAGYSLCAILYAEAIASFIDNEPLRGDSVFERYLYFSGAFMTLGIVTGAVWAYETLGWGGFWGWDPVENGSLVSWLFLAALLHYPGSRSKKRFGPFLVLLPFLSVLFFTFLTRSGLLADISVHSFDVSVLALPLGLLFLACTLLPVALFLHFRKTRNEKNNESRESLSAAGQFIVIYAAIIYAATVFPVLLALFGKQVSAVPAEKFTKMSLVLSSAMFAVMSYSYIRYRDRKRIITASLLFILIMGYMVFRIPLNVWVALISMTAAAAFALSVAHIKKYFEKSIAHAGLALCVIGIVLSGALSSYYRLELPRDEKINAGVAHLVFRGVAASSSQEFILDYSTGSTVHTYAFPFSVSKEGSLSVQKTLVIHRVMHDIHLTPEGFDDGLVRDNNRIVLKGKEVLLVSMTVKPLMLLVWTGMCMIITGLFVGAVRRKKRNAV